MNRSPRYYVRRLNGLTREFSSVSAFDGYVNEIRRNGYTVIFSDLFHCFVLAKP